MTFEMLLEERKEEAFAQGREKGIEEGIEKGREEGTYNTRLETAKKAFSMNLSPKDISNLTGLSVEEISKLKKDKRQ